MSLFTNLKYEMNFLHAFYIKLIKNIAYKFIKIHVSIFSTETRSHSLKKNHSG